MGNGRNQKITNHWSVQETAKFLGVCDATVYRTCKKNDLEWLRRYGKIFIEIESAKRYKQGK